MIAYAMLGIVFCAGVSLTVLDVPANFDTVIAHVVGFIGGAATVFALVAHEVKRRSRP